MESTYYATIHQSLTQVILIGGIPRELAILNGTFTAALVFGFHSVLSLFVGLSIHVLARYAAIKDEQFFYTFRRSVRYKKYFNA